MSLPDVHSTQSGAAVDFSNFLKNFAIDYWYKMLLIASLIFMVIALTMKIYVISNGALLLVSMGGFFIGMGEWINHPYREFVNLSMGAKVSGHPRSPKIGGILLDIAGALLALIGIAMIVWQALGVR